MHQSALTHRKIYATSEERKQRNRQAQAAFRERRTEYIKQLESTIKHHEDTLQNLQQSHRSAADECLMLRYKNSLLERILLEKGTIHPTMLPLAPGLTASRY
jgi:phage shock protein A